MKYANYVFRKWGYQAMVQFKTAEKFGLSVPECLIFAEQGKKDRRKSARK